MKRISGVLAVVAGAMVMGGCASPMSWEETLEQRLPVYGHRNWIVVADAAYPKQSAPGIETVYTGGEHLEVLARVLRAVEDAPHVRAVVKLDAELEHVSERDAPGVEAYRQRLDALVEGRPVLRVPHEEIIDALDEGARLFDILLLKTDLAIPYTSVFLELDCGYWSEEQEARLREAIAE